MKAHQTTIGKTDEWLTPPYIIEALGEFDLDPCDAINNPFRTAETTWVVFGHILRWEGRVWLNPPFNRYERPIWMKKMSEHNNGIMMIPAATETTAFFKYVFNKATAICFMKGRPHYYLIDGTKAKFNSGCAMCLIAYGEENYKALLNSNLGHTVKL